MTLGSNCQFSRVDVNDLHCDFFPETKADADETTHTHTLDPWVFSFKAKKG